MLQYLLYNIGIRIALILPVKIGYGIARAIALLQYAICRRDRKGVINNLKVITGIDDEKILAPIAKRVFINFAKYLADFFRFSVIDKQYVEKFVKIEGEQHVDLAFRHGKGVIAVTAHIGNWELAGIVIAMSGYPVNAIALSHKDRRVNGLFVRQRQAKGVKVIPVGVAVRRCFTALKNNELIGLLGDRDFTQAGIEVEFLGKMVRMPKGYAIFYLKSGAPILPLFMIRQPDDTYKLIYEKPLDYALTGQGEQDLKNITKEFVKVLEKIIRRYPDQWFMFREFWDENANKL